VTDVFESYFGSLKCVAWSPDSRFIAVGGQDDLVTIYSPRESRLVARCQGHTGIVTGIAFDPTMRSEGRGYRFGSVGEDGKLLLWDLSVAALRKPRHYHSNSSHFRVPGVASNASLPLVNADGATFHPAPHKSEVAMLQPILARIIEGNLMTSLHMGPKTICTVSRSGSVKFWTRPPKQPRKRKTDKVDKRRTE
jgi:WD40 repeat protein